MPFGDAEGVGFKRVPSLPRRDGQGNLLPMKVPIYGEEEINNQIVMIPLTIGRINELNQKEDIGININFERVLCEECLIEPKLSWEEYTCMRPNPRWKLFLTLAFESGFSVDEYVDPKKKRIKVPESQKSDKRRMYESLKKDLGYARECFSLQDANYNFITMQSLCRREVSILIDVAKEAHKKGSKGGKKPAKPKKGRKGRKR